MVKYLVGFTSDVIAAATIVLFLGTIAVTYTLCVHEKSCPVFLPTISDTWITPPGSYLSRWAVNLGCCIFMLGNIAVYWGNSKDEKTVTSLKGASNELLLGMAQVGVFCLSCVGAICDSSDPDCRGNNNIHTTCAVTFFVLYDFYMIFLLRKFKDFIHTSRSYYILMACVVVSIVSKVRWIPNLHAGSFPALAVFEWADVAVIAIFTAKWLVRHDQTYDVGLVNLDDTEMEKSTLPQVSTGSNVTVLSFFSTGLLTNITMGVGVFVVATTWWVAVKEKHVPGDELPNMSLAWVYAPGDWISRWGLNLSANLFFWLEIALYYYRIDAQENKILARVLLAVAFISSGALSVTGCVNISENETLHHGAGYTFFIGYTIYMAIALASAALSGHMCSGKFAGQAFCFLLALFCKVRYVSHNCIFAGVRDALPAPDFQWADFIAIYAFFYMSVTLAGNNSKKYGLAIVQSATETSKL